MFVTAAGGRNKRGVVLGTGALARELVPSTRGRTGARPPGEDVVPVLRQQLQQMQEEVQQLREQQVLMQQMIARQEALMQQMLAGRQQPPLPEPAPRARQVCIKHKLFFI